VEGRARLDYLLAETGRADHARYLCALFAPAERREPLLALALLNRELARVPSLVSQPIAGLIRYQWWREAIGEAAAGSPRDQPVVEGLAAGLARGWLAAGDLEALVDAREPELEEPPPGDPDALTTRLETTEGRAQELAFRCLGGTDPNQGRAARLVGTALGLARAAGATRRVAADDADRYALLDRATDRLLEARRLASRPPRDLVAAFLPGRLVAGDVRRLRHARVAPFAAAGGQGDPPRPPLTVLGLAWASATRRY
jgi:phytoene synthase